jgi:hypothetical protein
MSRKRMNSVMAGYHILMILSAVDYKFHIEEEKIIREYLFQQFPFQVNLDRQIEAISNLLPSEWEPHFLQCMDDFVEEATIEERHNLMKFSIYLIKADEVLAREENVFIKMLFEAWDNERE